MCPNCIATAALVVASANSTGGLVAIAMDKLHAKNRARGAELMAQITKAGTQQNKNGTDEHGLWSDEISTQAARDRREEESYDQNHRRI